MYFGISCVSMGENMFFGSIVGSDYYYYEVACHIYYLEVIRIDYHASRSLPFRPSCSRDFLFFFPYTLFPPLKF